VAVLSKRSILEGLASSVREMVDKGERPPWQKPWTPSPVSAMPLHNPVTDRPYLGSLNTFTLFVESAIRGYEDPRWLGYRQARAEGWQVRKGESASHIYVPVQIKTKGEDGEPVTERDPDTGEEKPRLFQAFKSVPVFNAEQIDGIPELAPERTAEASLPRSQELDAIAEAMGVRIVTTADRAFYSSQVDRIGLPARSAFADQGGYDSTKAHELAHATGHASRLDRPLGNRFGTPAYAFEELVAEAAAYTLCRSLGLPYTGENPDMDREQSATYLAGWSSQLDGDALAKALDKAVTAAGYLQRALEQARERGLLEERSLDEEREQERTALHPQAPAQQEAGMETEPHHDRYGIER
jgi:antirestriction protein ArdC